MNLQPVKVSRTSSDCERKLHCFRPTRNMELAGTVGACRACGAEPIAWHRIQQRNPEDLEYTFASLRLEMIREFFWRVELDPRAVNYARRRGRRELRTAVEARLRKSIGPARIPFDGRQTPREGSGNPIHYAQHGTATCCRVCLEYWYRIPRGHALTVAELAFVSALAMGYLERRLPDLSDQGVPVPRLR